MEAMSILNFLAYNVITFFNTKYIVKYKVNILFKYLVT